MLIRSRPSWSLPEAEVTPQALYQSRRAFIGGAAALVGSALLAPSALAEAGLAQSAEAQGLALEGVSPGGALSTGEDLTPWRSITSYNNFYEFGLGKEDPARYAHVMNTRPWSITIDGAVGKPGPLDIEDLLADFDLEERIYRLRCVEAWSMVVPWIGVPLAAVLRRVEPTSAARYVRFETLHNPNQMPGQRRAILDWPYVEGLRLDEAMNPLTLLAVGLYGVVLPNQNGAPVRLVVPWKYGFKSIKSIVRITLTEEQPVGSWEAQTPQEYGFYANVNPTVDHPRWSQARERRIGEWSRRETLMFNGYGEQVAHLYTGMDLARHY